jgi:hypothetical protein
MVSGGSGWLGAGGEYLDVFDDPDPVAGNVGGGGGSDGGGGAVTVLLGGQLSRCVSGCVGDGGFAVPGAAGAGIEPLTVRTGLGIAGIVSTELPLVGVALDVVGNGVPAAGPPRPVAGAPRPDVGCCVPSGAIAFESCERGGLVQPLDGVAAVDAVAGVWVTGGKVVRLPPPRQHESLEQQPLSMPQAATKLVRP